MGKGKSSEEREGGRGKGRGGEKEQTEEKELYMRKVDKVVAFLEGCQMSWGWTYIWAGKSIPIGYIGNLTM